MQGPQLEDGYTRIANEIVEQIGKRKLNGTQRAIIDQIWRYTYGFGRKDAELSLSFLSQAIGSTKSHVDREITALIDRNIVLVTGKTGRGRTLQFNKYFEEWKDRPTNIGQSQTVLQIEDGESYKCGTEPSYNCSTKQCGKYKGNWCNYYGLS